MRSALVDQISRRLHTLTSRFIPRARGVSGRSNPRRRPEDSKVFCIGFNKTGTSSLHALFEQAGFRSHHGMAWRRM